MKKVYILLMVAAGLVGLFAACEVIDSNEIEETTQTQTLVYISANGNETGTKASIDGDGGKFTWNVGDQIAVWAGGYKTSVKLTAAQISTEDAGIANFAFSDLVQADRANFALFPASLADAAHSTETDFCVNMPGSYKLAEVRGEVSPIAMIATNTPGQTLAFKQLGALLRVTVNSIPPSATYLKLNFNGKKVQGSFALAANVNPGTTEIVTKAASEGNDVITITDLGSDHGWMDGVDINIPVPTGEYTNLTVTAYNASDVAVLSMTRPIKVSANWTPTRAGARKVTASLPAFSVSDTKRVHIAKSNLQLSRPDTTKSWADYQELGDLTWSFMDNAWSRESATDMEVDFANKTEIRCFSWGATGQNFNEGKDPEEYVYGIYYQPWNTPDGDENKSASARKGSDFGPKGKNMTLTGTFELGDWGKKICEGGKTLDDGYGASSQWRLFTGAESLYMFGKTKSPTYSGSAVADPGDAEEGTVCYERRHNLWTICTVNGIPGVLLVPDYFVNPTNVSVRWASLYPTGASKGAIITAEQWVLMEAAGAAFLPLSTRVMRKSGAESGLAPDVFLAYWTSTGSTTQATHAVGLSGGGQASGPIKVDPATASCNRRNGVAVRLVRDLN